MSGCAISALTCPEKGKPFFELCRNANNALVENKKVRIQTDTVAVDTDGRQLVYVYVDQIFVNAELIKNGYGLVAAPDGNVQHRDFFLELQQEARKNRRGLWAFEDQSDEPYYVGSKSGKIFHRPSCSHVKGLAFDDRLIFRTKAEALTGGYSQDWRCCPLFKKSEQPSASTMMKRRRPGAVKKKAFRRLKQCRRPLLSSSPGEKRLPADSALPGTCTGSIIACICQSANKSWYISCSSTDHNDDG